MSGWYPAPPGATAVIEDTAPAGPGAADQDSFDDRAHSQRALVVVRRLPIAIDLAF